MIDLRRLQVFLAVADTGSFTAAAQRLFLSQPGVSQQISLLERELGESLFVRTARGVSLNEAGVFLRDRARPLLDQAVALEQDFRDHHDGVVRVTIGAFPTAGVEMLPRAFNQLMAKWPGLKLQLRQLDTTDPLSLLREHRADMVMMFEYDIAPRPVDPEFEYAAIANDPLCVILPQDHRLAKASAVSLSELADETWVLRRHRAPYQHIHEQIFKSAGIDASIGFWTDDYQSLQGLVAARVGVSIVPSLAIVQHRNDIVVKPLAQPAFRRRVNVAMGPQFAASEIGMDIVSTLRTVAENRRA
jgi:DNA-binding transcriptional LysR family regulator